MFNSGSLGSGNVVKEWLPLTQKEACITSTQALWVDLWLLSFIGYHLVNLRWRILYYAHTIKVLNPDDECLLMHGLWDEAKKTLRER
jgi:hypothetical protein